MVDVAATTQSNWHIEIATVEAIEAIETIEASSASRCGKIKLK